jgi:thiol-disulfide isomerase/thioredoxin
VLAAARAEGHVTAGLVALVAALAVATAVGAAWRATNGKMRSPRRSASAGTGLSAATGLSAGSTLAADSAVSGLVAADGTRVTMAEIGRPLGARATLLQFSSAFCAPCRATRRILAEVAGLTEGVTHVEIDAESRLDLVRALGVLRTPTVLVLAADGRIVRRASGQPRKADVIGALGEAVESGTIDGGGAESAISYSSGLETG